MLNVDETNLELDPFPFLVQNEVLDPDFYAELKAAYPDFQRPEGWGRMSRDLMRGDQFFDETVSKEPWARFFNYINSQPFVDDMLKLFAAHIPEDQARFDHTRLTLTNYVETRDYLGKGTLSKDIREYAGPKEEVFVRMDFGLGDVGYSRPNHLDWRHRICSLLIYFDDPVETKMSGGEFTVNRMSSGKGDVVATVLPQNNQGIFKLDSNDSYHAVTPITAINGARKTLYIAISSRGRVWQNGDAA